MIRRLRAAAACAAALFLATPAVAQNTALRAPAWAQPLTAADVTPTTGGRVLLEGEGIVSSVRVTIAPTRGGVARVIRYDDRGETGHIALRRFTGHPSTGWWLWGPDSPLLTPATAAQKSELATLMRGANGIAQTLGEAAVAGACESGEQAYVELYVGGRTSSATRTCVAGNDAFGRLAMRLSEIAGSRTEEELAEAAVAELTAADRAFAAMARAQGVPAAFAHYAAADAVMLTSEAITSGHQGVVQRFASWPQGARLEWTPELARVSARGDMGWTWGNSVYTAPDGTRTAGRYISVWTRDYEGNWRYAFDAPIR